MNNFNLQKNIAKGLIDEIAIEDGFSVITFDNSTPEIKSVERQIDSSFIQFHFCLKGSSEFLFNAGNYKLPIANEQSLLLYNPQRELPLHLVMQPNTWIVTLLISIKKFHGLPLLIEFSGKKVNL